MQAWLKAEGVSVATSTLSSFMSSQRDRRCQETLLQQIASGAEQVKEVEAQFGKSPAPELETLIKLHRVLILQLSTQGNADPEFLRLADQLMRTAMEFVSGQTKARQKETELQQSERKLVLIEKKAAAFDSAKGVMEDKELSDEQKRARMHELFGLA